MDLHNNTPFPALEFDAMDTHGQTFHTVVARATFAIGERVTLRLADEQRPLVMADELYGDIGTSSVKEESDLAPFKPKCDVVVIGDAAAPGNTAARRFEAGVTIRRNGDILLNKLMAVTGPRYWKKRLFPLTGWKLTEPEPVQSVPLRYEYAYGGECRIKHDDPAAKRVPKKVRLTPERRAALLDGIERAPAAHTCFGGNNVGIGYAEKWYLSAKRLRRIQAPQIESISDPIKTFAKAYPPQGLGFLAKSCASRIRFAGTMDEAFIQSGKSLPDDFNFAYWNGAPTDMQIPWLEGNEEITLINIGGIEQMVLPEHKLCAMATYEDDRMAVLDFNADTLIINTDQKTVSLVYRLNLPPEPDVQSLEIHQVSIKDREILLNYAHDVTRQVLHYAEASHE